MSFQLMNLTREMQMDVLLQLQPRHVYKLMQTNKTLYFLCRSEAYWARVAAYLLWGCQTQLCVGFIETTLLRQSYRATVDDYIKCVRSDLRTFSPPDCNYADLSLVELVLEGEKKLLGGIAEFTPSTNTFRAAKRYVEDVDHVDAEVKLATVGTHAPRRAYFITRRRRATQVSETFLRSLEDDEGMDLDAKKRVQRYAIDLLNDICATGVFREHKPPGDSDPTVVWYDTKVGVSDIIL